MHALVNKLLQPSAEAKTPKKKPKPKKAPKATGGAAPDDAPRAAKEEVAKAAPAGTAADFEIRDVD